MDKSLELTLVEIAKNVGISYADPESLKETLKATVFKQAKAITDSEFLTLLAIAKEHKLNPFTKEIYAYPSMGGIVPIIGVDGWLKLMNTHPDFDGIEWRVSEKMFQGTLGSLNTSCFIWAEAIIHHKNRHNPTIVREYLDETYRNTPAWNTSPKRMLRHKATIQCIRIAFGLGGIYEEDEAAKIVEMQVIETVNATPNSTYTFKELEKSVANLGLGLRLVNEDAYVVGNTFQKDHLLKELGFVKKSNQWSTKVIQEIVPAIENNDISKNIATDAPSALKDEEITIPTFNTQEDLETFLKSLGLEVVSEMDSKQRVWIKVTGNASGLEDTLLKIGFKMHKNNFVLNVTELLCDSIQTELPF